MAACPAPFRVLAALFILVEPCPAVAQVETPAYVIGTAVIEDGDTLSLGPVTIRLHGIDAHETRQRCTTASGGQWACGTDATARLNALAGKRKLRDARGPPDYGSIGR